MNKTIPQRPSNTRLINKTNLTLSVVIPTRDREQVLEECILRLLKETFNSYEIIIIDSSSTDATKDLLENYLKEYSPITYHKLGDIPYSMVLGRNVGISIARGEIIAFIDDDCFILPGWMDEITKYFDDASIVAVGGRIIYHPWETPSHDSRVAILDLEKDVIQAHWNTIVDGVIDVPMLPGGNCAVRREIAFAVNGFDTKYIGSANLEETDFFLRVSNLGGRIIFNPCAVVEHRAAPRADGISREYTNFIYRYSMVRNRLYFLRKHQAKGLMIGIRRQILDFLVGTTKLIVNTCVFGMASLAGIIVGLVVKPTKYGGTLSELSRDD